MWKLVLILGLGGFLGTIGRFLIGHYIQEFSNTSFPVGTLVVNILGSFLLGLVYALAEKNQWSSPELRLFFTVGFCGGFTTFSTFSFDIFRLSSDFGFIYPLFYAVGSVFTGVLAVWGGVALIKGL